MNRKTRVRAAALRSTPATARDTGAALSLASRRKPTINDIARLANVSKKTVSRVINQSPFVREETRTRISDIMQRMAYTPDPQARGLAFRRSFLIGLVYDNPNAQYVVNIQEGVLCAIRRSGFELVVHPCDRTRDTFLSEVRSFVARQKLDGVIVLPPISEDPAFSDMLECHYVRVLPVLPDEASGVVASLDREAAGQVAEHLAKLGHTRIGLIDGPASYRSARERRTGFSSGLDGRGLMLPADYVVAGAYTFDSGFRCADVLLGRFPRPTAIFACNDEMAAGVYKAASLRGLKIPDDLTVVGFDDSPLASSIWPTLTTVRLPIHDLGRIAAERLIAKVHKHDGTTAHVATVLPQLIVRDSSAGPPG